MPDNTENDLIKEMERIYSDTNYFIEGITEEYGFYGHFIDAMRNGGAFVNINRKTIHKKVEEQWISAIEACLPAIDIVTRKHSIGIEEREEVLPIELSRNINDRSIRHLAQHSDYISSVRGDDITPSKILNVFHEETMQTYENKFVNTLIQRLYFFVEKRYAALVQRGTEESGVSLDFDGSFSFGSSEGKISLKIEVSDPGDNENSGDSLSRIVQLRGVLARYLDSPFVKAMQGGYIRPPVMRTNAISKNKYLRQCLDLWDYIESYEKVGYVIDVEEKAEKPGDEFIKGLYSLLSLQYMIFDYNIHHGFTGMPEVLASKQTEEPLSPDIITDIQRVDVKDYNVYDTEYRRVVNVSSLTGGRRLSKDETRIRDAVDIALAADREIELIRKRNARSSGKRKALQEKTS
ncbi:MAG: DUF2357 domain-containing protein [Eubacteriales bacterium]